jgi:hypothetical protein
VHVRSRKEDEEEMLIVWHCDKVVRLIHAGDLMNCVQSLQLTLPGKKVTLVIYGAEEYFRSELSTHSHTGMQLKQYITTLSLYYGNFWLLCLDTAFPLCSVTALVAIVTKNVPIFVQSCTWQGVQEMKFSKNAVLCASTII